MVRPLKPRFKFEIEGLGKVYRSMGRWDRALEAFYSVGAVPFSGSDLVIARMRTGPEGVLSRNAVVIPSAIIYVPRGRNMIVAKSPLLDLELAKVATARVKEKKEFFLTAEEVEIYMMQAEEDKDKPPSERRAWMLDNFNDSERKIIFPLDEIADRDETLMVLGDQAKNYARLIESRGQAEFTFGIQPRSWVDKQPAAYVKQMDLSSINVAGIGGCWGANIFIGGTKYMLNKGGEFREEVSFIRRMRGESLRTIIRGVDVEKMEGVDPVEKPEAVEPVEKPEAVEPVERPEAVEDVKSVATQSGEKILEGYSLMALEKLKSASLTSDELRSLLTDFVEREYTRGMGIAATRRASELAELVGSGDSRRMVDIESCHSKRVGELAMRRRYALDLVLDYVGREEGKKD